MTSQSQQQVSPKTETQDLQPPGQSPIGRKSPVERAADFGVGARITVSVMSDDFAEIILGAIEATDTTDLLVETDQVSTFVRGDEQRICQFLSDLIAAAARSGRHVSAAVLLSRGCPGEVCRVVEQLPATDVPQIANTRVPVVAQWALYPLADNASGGIDADHMRDIYQVIERSKRSGTFLRGDHFVTTLSGDLADVLATVADGWITVGRHVQHVATHLTISVNSPSSGTGDAR